MPPQWGIAPRIRIGKRWINTLWSLPIGAAALLCLIALAQSLRELPSVTAFIQRHPGIVQSVPSVNSGFPWWLEVQHFLNMFFSFIMRAGLQILADHPRLYWGRDCTPETDWFRFQVPIRRDGFGQLRTTALSPDLARYSGPWSHSWTIEVVAFLHQFALAEKRRRFFTCCCFYSEISGSTSCAS